VAAAYAAGNPAGRNPVLTSIKGRKT